MGIRGAELIQRLETMVQVSTRARHREISEEFGSLIAKDLDAMGLRELAAEAFDFLRKWRRDETSIKKIEEGLLSSEDERDPLLHGDRESREPWLRLSIETLRELFMDHKRGFDASLNEYNNIKSKATHVLAVFRPFKDKYLSEWARFFDAYPEDEIRAHAEKLRLELIADKFDLHIWHTAIYDLFKSAAVYNQSFERKRASIDSTKGHKRLPQGMISSTSERVYGQQWRLWLRENDDEIMQFVSPIREALPDTRPATPLATATSSLRTLEVQKGALEKEIAVKAAVVSMPDLVATETWHNSDYSDAELRKWLGLMEEVWALDGKPVLVTVSIKSDLKSSNLTLKPMPTSEAMTAISSVLRRSL